jgi:hypothetical protein
MGGKDHYPVDREAAEHVLALYPDARQAAQENRAFMTRAVRFLVSDGGIRQFLDIGPGLPASPNLHEVAQGVAPVSRVVYTDNDALVLMYARAQMVSAPDGRVSCVDADLREPDRILADPLLRDTLDLSQPVALCLVGILPFLCDDDEAYAVVRHLVDALPAGSHLLISHATSDGDPALEKAAGEYARFDIPVRLRTRAEIASFFDGLTLIEPGLQTLPDWRPDTPATGGTFSAYGAVARKDSRPTPGPAEQSRWPEPPPNAVPPRSLQRRTGWPPARPAGSPAPDSVHPLRRRVPPSTASWPGPGAGP